MPNMMIKKLKLADIKKAQYNPRSITDEAFEGLHESIEKFGLIDVPVVNAVDGEFRMIGGHQRLDVLMEAGYEWADCLVVQLDDLDERAANLSLNNPAIQGKWDYKRAVDNVQEVLKRMPKPSDMEMEQLKRTLKKEASRNPQLRAGADKFAAKEEIKSEQGVTYKLGQHKLYCGDALSLPKTFFGKKKAHATITDPPYHVNYESGNESSLISGDKEEEGQWRSFLRDAVQVILKQTEGPSYIFMSCKELPRLQATWEAEGGAVLQWLVWVKSQPTVMVMRPCDFCSQHETILYGAKKGSDIYLPAVPRVNVFAIDKPHSNAFHPTQKPQDLIELLVLDAVDPGEIVFDPFAGSGTTLMACEKLQRVCYAAEVETRFADVIRKRWSDAVHGGGCDWEGLTPVQNDG